MWVLNWLRETLRIVGFGIHGWRMATLGLKRSSCGGWLLCTTGVMVESWTRCQRKMITCCVFGSYQCPKSIQFSRVAYFWIGGCLGIRFLTKRKKYHLVGFKAEKMGRCFTEIVAFSVAAIWMVDLWSIVIRDAEPERFSVSLSIYFIFRVPNNNVHLKKIWFPIGVFLKLWSIPLNCKYVILVSGFESHPCLSLQLEIIEGVQFFNGIREIETSSTTQLRFWMSQIRLFSLWSEKGVSVPCWRIKEFLWFWFSSCW